MSTHAALHAGYGQRCVGVRGAAAKLMPEPAPLLCALQTMH